MSGRERMLRDKFIRSLPDTLQEKVKLASLVGVRNVSELVAIAQNMQEPVRVARVQPSEMERKVEQLTRMVEKLTAELSVDRNSKSRLPRNRNIQRCYHCNQPGHFAKFCTNRNINNCFSFSLSSKMGVPQVQIKIENRVVEGRNLHRSGPIDH